MMGFPSVRLARDFPPPVQDVVGKVLDDRVTLYYSPLGESVARIGSMVGASSSVMPHTRPLLCGRRAQRRQSRTRWCLPN